MSFHFLALGLIVASISVFADTPPPPHFPIDPLPPPRPHLTQIESLSASALSDERVKVDVTYSVPCPNVYFSSFEQKHLSKEGADPVALAVGVLVTPGTCDGPARAETKSLILDPGNYQFVKMEHPVKYTVHFSGQADTSVQSVDLYLVAETARFLRDSLPCSTVKYPKSRVTTCKDSRHEIILVSADAQQFTPRTLYSSIIEDQVQVEANAYCEESPQAVDCYSR
jgi:hypothetical protein